MTDDLDAADIADWGEDAWCPCTRHSYTCIDPCCECGCHDPPPPHDPLDPIGVTLWAKTADGRKVSFRQPLVDPSRRAAGTWSGDGGLIRQVQLFLHNDPDESSDNLHSVAVALCYTAGEGGEVSQWVTVLAYHHPREELERGAREREYRDRHGWDDPPEVSA